MLLSKVRHHPATVLFIELDHILQRMNTYLAIQRFEILIQVRFELVMQYFEFRFRELVEVGNIGGIDDHCIQMLHHLDTLLEDLDDVWIRASHVPGNADPCTFEPLAIKELCITGKAAL